MNHRHADFQSAALPTELPGPTGPLYRGGPEPWQAGFAQRRAVGFQDARLLPWARVLDNVVLGLPGRDARERGTRALAEKTPGKKRYLNFGASPRATLAFSEAARAVAFLRGRGYVVPEDVKEIARDVLRHRVLLTYEAEAEGLNSEQIITRILDELPVP